MMMMMMMMMTINNSEFLKFISLSLSLSLSLMGDHWEYSLPAPKKKKNVVTPLLATSETIKEDGVTVLQLPCHVNISQF